MKHNDDVLNKSVETNRRAGLCCWSPFLGLMPKFLTVIVFFLSSLASFAGDALLPPLKAIDQFGGISISDASSYFTFSKDGLFESGPLGMSGRTMKGR